MNSSQRQPSDSFAATIAMLTATLMIAQHVASKATRDAFFLTHFAATDLPKAMMGAAVLSIVSALTMARILTWAGPARLVPGIFGLSAALYVCEWFLALAAPPIAAAVLYLHVAILGALVITGFWSVVNERFDPYAAKKAVGRIVAGATLGGILGGIIAQRVTALLDLRAMLLVVGAMHAVCALGVLTVAGQRRRALGERAPAADAASIGLQPLRESSYLQQMALLMVLTAIAEAFVDYALKAEAAARFSGGEGLVTFFAAFYTITGVATFLFQKTLSPWALRHLGLGRTMALLPGALLVGSVLGSLVTRLWSVVLVRGSEAILSNSAFRSGFELLYTPVAEAKKRSSKAIIDVAGQRVGDFVGGGLVLVLVSLAPTGSNSVIVGAASIAAAAALLVVYRLHSGYVDQLADSLRRGTVSISEGDIFDATTAHTLAESRLAIDREQLLAEIEHYRAQVSETPPSGGAAADDASAPARRDSLLESMQVLLSQDRRRVREVLGEERLDLRLVPQLIRLVLQPEVRDDAIGALRKVAPRIIGQLTDHLLDPGQTVLLRTALPPVLEGCDDPRAMEGLLAGLGCEHFAVRFGCAQSLARMKRRNPAASIPSGAIFAAVQRELNVGRDVWENQGMLVRLEQPDERDWLDSSLRRTVNRSLEHVFTLLALALDLDTVRTVLRGLTSQQANLRGTALEYLENVLPEETREALWPYVCKTPVGRKSKRSRDEIVKELHRFRDSLDFD